MAGEGNSRSILLVLVILAAPMVAMLESGQEYPGILNPSERSSTYFNHYQVSYTSFEDPTSGSYYQDEGDASISRVLENNPGQMSVSHASSGSEMGFETHYESTGGVGRRRSQGRAEGVAERR